MLDNSISDTIMVDMSVYFSEKSDRNILLIGCFIPAHTDDVTQQQGLKIEIQLDTLAHKGGQPG